MTDERRRRACEFCRWSARDGSNNGYLRCHFNPPNPIFPVVSAQDFCREFDRKDEPRKEVR